MDSFVEAFRKEIYEPAEQKFIAATNQYLLANELDFKRRFKHELQAVIEKIVISEVNYISFSVLYTTIYFKQPQVLVEVFSKDEQLAASGYIDISWLFDGWSEFNTILFNQSTHLRKTLRQANIESFMWQSVDILTYLLSAYMRYWLREFINLDLQKTFSQLEEFYCFCGKYSDKKEIVYAKRPAIDLSEAWQEKLAYYCNFNTKKYSKLLWEDVDLSYTVFENCRFENCTFNRVDLLDASFIHCRFFNVKFSQVAMSGSLFISDYFYECSFADIKIDGTMINNSEQTNVYRLAQIIGARFVKTDLSQIPKEGCLFIDSKEEMADE